MAAESVSFRIIVLKVVVKHVVFWLHHHEVDARLFVVIHSFRLNWVTSMLRVLL